MSKNKNAVALGKMAAGHKKTMTPAALKQRRDAAKSKSMKANLRKLTPKRPIRRCVICGARVRNINPKVKTCSSDCTAKLHGTPSPPVRPVELCIHCGVPCGDDEGQVCNDCYSQYTPAMLNDMDQ